MVNLILPAAGKSSRFPTKAKWLLTHPKGSLMIMEALNCLDLKNITNIYITIVKKHYDKYCKNVNLKKILNVKNKKMHILILDNFTKSQSHTVYETIKHFNIMGSIFIKDCDNYFNFTPYKGNYICYTNIDSNIHNVHNKSFIEFNNIKQITNICEKKVISNYICVGGYSFDKAEIFINEFDKISNINCINYKELYISHIINSCLFENIIFMSEEITNYLDWGTYEDWLKYCKLFKTLFIDIDGVLVKNSSQYFEPRWGTTEEIKKNVDIIKSLYSNKKTKIILTTARKKEFKEITIQQLKNFNIPFDDIIFGLFHCKRYLINDFSNTNPYPTSISINLKRDNNNLNDFL